MKTFILTHRVAGESVTFIETPDGYWTIHSQERKINLPLHSCKEILPEGTTYYSEVARLIWDTLVGRGFERHTFAEELAAGLHK